MQRDYIKENSERVRKIFADNLRYYMKEKGIKQQMMAQEINVNQTTISSWLRCLTEPSLSQLILLAEFFGCAVEDLYN